MNPNKRATGGGVFEGKIFLKMVIKQPKNMLNQIKNGKTIEFEGNPLSNSYKFFGSCGDSCKQTNTLLMEVDSIAGGWMMSPDISHLLF